MRHFLKKKNNLSKITAIFVLLLFIVLYACEKEFLDSAYEKEQTQAIDRAKAWYEMNKPEAVEMRSSNGTEKVSMKPDWTYAFLNKNEKYEIVETDLAMQGIFGFIDKDCMAKYKETNDDRYKPLYTRLVICTDRKTNETVSFLMTQVPNLEWLEKSKFKPFKKSCYLNLGKDFGGAILFHNLDGSFSNGWVYENGKITASISSMEEGPAEFSLRSTTCYQVDVYLVWQQCTDYYTVHEDYDTYSGSVCTTWTEYSHSYDACFDDGTGSGGYNSGGGGDGGATGSGTPINPCFSGIAGNSNNNVMLSDPNIKNGMDTILKDYAKNSYDEWAVSIGRNPDGTYYVTPAKNSGTNGHTTIPDLPYGMPLVTYGHSHGKYGRGVPSPGDLYSFLESIASNFYISSMYVYGTGPNDTPETYAINVYDKAAISAFLIKYPKSANMMSTSDAFVNTSDLYERYNNAMKAYSNGNYNYQAGAYQYVPEAFALSYIMSSFNMGVTLSRKVNNDSFMIINTQNVNNTYNITTCN